MASLRCLSRGLSSAHLRSESARWMCMMSGTVHCLEASGVPTVRIEQPSCSKAVPSPACSLLSHGIAISELWGCRAWQEKLHIDTWTLFPAGLTMWDGLTLTSHQTYRPKVLKRKRTHGFLKRYDLDVYGTSTRFCLSCVAVPLCEQRHASPVAVDATGTTLAPPLQVDPTPRY